VDAPAADAPVAARKPADGAPLGRLAVSPVEGEMALARAVPAHAPPARHDGGALPTAAGGRSDGLPRAFAGAPGPDVTPGAQIDRDASVAQRSRAAATAPGDSLADDAAAEPDPGLARVGRLRETDREADGATAARIAASSAALRDTGAGASGPVLRAGTAEPSMPATPGASLAPDPSLAPPRAVQTVDLSAAVSREPSSAADALHRGREHYVELGQRLADAIGGRISAQVARGAWSVEIRLLPASLGAVQVRLARDGARIVARLEASEGSTRDLLAEGAARLRDCLAQAGVDAVEVQVGLEQRGDRGKNTAFAGSAGNVKIGSRSTEESEVPARRPDTGVHRLDVLV
jgi:hypothetical protein